MTTAEDFKKVHNLEVMANTMDFEVSEDDDHIKLRPYEDVGGMLFKTVDEALAFLYGIGFKKHT
jgi:hypothetical protein